MALQVTESLKPGERCELEVKFHKQDIGRLFAIPEMDKTTTDKNRGSRTEF